ncbi:hypothetical protein [Psychroserpens sp. NJDZ02]|uniref:hypothetical protein n=1 Tax=Psychroserpens sp. NJDZ02 TaxID=2570561 RepID=UPI0010A78415|nr:hypothetical protein [Psychroserpens sp. NJDZ02]QCE42812.1 hypothetical protein E9099_15810 [Psychroserpens sp. NJDZ02]
MDLLYLNCDTCSDQTSFFNLYDASDFINNFGNTNYQQLFYRSYLYAENNTSPIENPQQIFVKNINPEGYYTINFFFIETSFSVLETIIVSEDSNGILLNNEGTFNLRNKSNATRN